MPGRNGVFWLAVRLFVLNRTPPLSPTILVFCKHPRDWFSNVPSQFSKYSLNLGVIISAIVHFYRFRKSWSFHDGRSLLEGKIFIVLKTRTFCAVFHLVLSSASAVDISQWSTRASMASDGQRPACSHPFVSCQHLTDSTPDPESLLASGIQRSDSRKDGGETCRTMPALYYRSEPSFVALTLYGSAKRWL